MAFHSYDVSTVRPAACADVPLIPLQLWNRDSTRLSALSSTTISSGVKTKNVKFIKLHGNVTLLMAYKYTFARSTPRHWYCSQKTKGCKAKVFLNNERNQVVFIKNEHNHEPPIYRQLGNDYYIKKT
ncbi:unnamed protein product [Chrysodeixis includens]|uniref:FLYWCH-type domain-containing protein n=1 Tax=Chrysodeixis includens TaxID=689277 RepID=A0A9P0BM48_CHRIL|nr:unnamed protein product [Chrysodeixis includens]